MNKEFVEHTSGLLVSSDGEVFVPRSGKRKEHFTYGCNREGYKVVMYKGKDYYVHRLVAETFIENPDSKPCVDHINMNRSDNRTSNLRWCTNQENQTFADQDVQKRKSKQVIQLSIDDEEIARFPSANEVQRVLGFSQGNISECCNGKRKSAYQYKWRYA